MFTYDVKKRLMMENGKALEGTDLCYSGHGECRNDPQKEDVPHEGPPPRGKYHIGKVYNHDHLGPFVMNLDPLPGTQMFGRSLFRIHGDNKEHNASHGCIICPRDMRIHIAQAQDRILEVV